MARGWESKAVTETQTAAVENRAPIPITTKQKRTPEQMDAMRRKANLALSRRRIVHELESSTNERYRELLTQTLADLDAQLAQFD